MSRILLPLCIFSLVSVSHGYNLGSLLVFNFVEQEESSALIAQAVGDLPAYSRELCAAAPRAPISRRSTASRKKGKLITSQDVPKDPANIFDTVEDEPGSMFEGGDEPFFTPNIIEPR